MSASVLSAAMRVHSHLLVTRSNAAFTVRGSPTSATLPSAYCAASWTATSSSPRPTAIASIASRSSLYLPKPLTAFLLTGTSWCLASRNSSSFGLSGAFCLCCSSASPLFAQKARELPKHTELRIAQTPTAPEGPTERGAVLAAMKVTVGGAADLEEQRVTRSRQADRPATSVPLPTCGMATFKVAAMPVPNRKTPRCNMP
mmetsp:Transcript_89029/g.230961  ORF Transcript_89029/g.230961 Transcript_89029/m.230961 type:complete len:201 (+) Transcript_89029:788-1390(+)